MAAKTKSNPLDKIYRKAARSKAQERPKWRAYERFKREIASQELSPEAYQLAIRRLVEILGI